MLHQSVGKETFGALVDYRKRLGCFLCVFASTAAQSSDVYSSADAEGRILWATQALDASYQKVTGLSVRDTQKPSLPPKHSIPFIRSAEMLKRRQTWQPTVEQAAKRHGVNAQPVMALIEVESAFHPNALSPKGARRLMQLMPATATRYGMRDVRELFKPERNLDMGVRHLKDLLTMHDGHVALVMASYNAGSAAVFKQGRRIPRYQETMIYVPAVMAASAASATTFSTAIP